VITSFPTTIGDTCRPRPLLDNLLIFFLIVVTGVSLFIVVQTPGMIYFRHSLLPSLPGPQLSSKQLD
jgi:hypothetical protein